MRSSVEHCPRSPIEFDRSGAADLSWNDADHSAPQAEDSKVFDSWGVDLGSPSELVPEIGSAGEEEFGRPHSKELPSGSNVVVDGREKTVVVTVESPADRRVGLRAFEQPASALQHDLERKLSEALNEILSALEYRAREIHDEGAVDQLVVEPPDFAIGTDPQDSAEAGIESSSADETASWDPAENETLDADWADGAAEFQPLEGDGYGQPNDNLGLFDYEEGARRLPSSLVENDEEVSIRRARAKAATITNLLDVTSVAERDAAVSLLTELFQSFLHSSTYRALEGLAANGLKLETLKTMTELRVVWMERTDWWVGRYRGQISFLRNGEGALTWKLAHSVCLARPEFSADTMIDEEWLDEWFALPLGTPGYSNFPAYIAEKVDSVDAEALHRGLRENERSNGYAEMGDDNDWHRRVSDRSGSLQGFRMVTPYDDRPGVIRLALHADDDETKA